MATSPQLALTSEYSSQQARRAAAVAALVALYYRYKVDPASPESIQRWIDLMTPRILEGSRFSAVLASAYAGALRKIEVLGIADHLYPPVLGVTQTQAAQSLTFLGSIDYAKKVREVRELPDLTPAQTKIRIERVHQEQTDKITASVARHVQNGGRTTIVEGAKTDPQSVGYQRVTTSARPCFFCVMLASRGPVFSEDSFDESDARFVGDGNYKVHDSDGCVMAPVVSRKSPLLEDSKKYNDWWLEGSAYDESLPGINSPIQNFRRWYEHYHGA